MFVCRRTYRWRHLALLAGVALAPESLAAQYVAPPPPAAYALQNVTIVSPEERREGVTIVVRNGMIDVLGARVTVPEDAEVLEGDSLLVYPGFVDAQGSAKYAFPDPDVERSQVQPWAPPRAVQSFVPHRRVVDHLEATGDDLEDSRQGGIVAAAVHADGRLMPGRGVLILARKDAEAPRELVVEPVLGPVMSFQGAPGVYPNQVFAVMAFIRQSFEDARRDGALRDAFSRDPRGLATPTWDPDYAVLRDVMDGAQPVFFVADESEDIRNVLRLADEYGFRPYIVGGEEAWEVADLLAEKRIPVLVSLDFPRPERWEPGPGPAAEEGEQQEPEPLSPEAEREKRRLEAIYANAARLAAAGVTFALTSGGGKADLREGARKATAYGLAEGDALRALTSTPAELLGIPHVARVQAGLPATFLVASGPIFEEETSILYTFVEGQLERGEEPGAAAGGEAPALDLTGSWEIVIDGEMTASMTVTQEEGRFSGTISTDFGPGRIRNGRVSGSDISFVISLDLGGQSMDIPVSGTGEGDAASGTGEGPDGEFTWTATRKRVP